MKWNGGGDGCNVKKRVTRVKNIRGLEGSTYERFTRDLATAKHLSSLAYTVDA